MVRLSVSLAAIVATSPLVAAQTGCAALSFGTTANDVVNKVCKPFTFIFARGTFEGGNLGNIVGPPMAASLVAQLGAANVAQQGVNDYAADVTGFQQGGSPSGTANLVQLIQQAKQNCPSTKLLVSGYSQGAQLVHKAAAQLSAAETAFINSVVLFGDPLNGKPVGNVPASRVSVDCHSDDNICQGGNNFLGSHLTYCQDTDAQAKFAVGLSGLKHTKRQEFTA